MAASNRMQIGTSSRRRPGPSGFGCVPCLLREVTGPRPPPGRRQLITHINTCGAVFPLFTSILPAPPQRRPGEGRDPVALVAYFACIEKSLAAGATTTESPDQYLRRSFPAFHTNPHRTTPASSRRRPGSSGFRLRTLCAQIRHWAPAFAGATTIDYPHQYLRRSFPAFHTNSHRTTPASSQRRPGPSGFGLCPVRASRSHWPPAPYSSATGQALRRGDNN
jgi:hypothetical protein